MKKNLRIALMACLMILSGTAFAQKTIQMPQQAFENLAAWLTANDYSHHLPAGTGGWCWW